MKTAIWLDRHALIENITGEEWEVNLRELRVVTKKLNIGERSTESCVN